ncbi:MAG TPA: NAD(P)H-hydrate dehydratase [Candidatus Acidoferrum sp.]|nr:NAD(P)H-hydrate dehydratase [Candidatus Acidoferrum sp.]
MKALTAAEMREVDRLTAENFGVSGEQLMESAGRSVAEGFLEQYAHKMSHAPGRIAVLCGKGNNGGDGFVVARYLKEEAEEVHVYLFANPEELKGDAAKNFERWRVLGDVALIRTAQEWEKAWPEVSTAEVIIDALLGTGVRGAASGLIGRAIDEINRFSRNATAVCPAWIVAVDTPSGLLSDGEAASGTVIQAHWTFTFTAPKIGQLVSPQSSSCGQLVVCDIGSPPALVEETGRGTLRWSGPDEFSRLPFIRPAESNKGLFGRVLVVAGSLGKCGAAVMSGYAAMRAGAGLVTIATPDVVLPQVSAAHPEYMTEPLASTMDGTIAFFSIKSGRFTQVLKGISILAIGPGIGQHPETQDFVRSVAAEAEVPIILDADGLNAFAGSGDLLRTKKTKSLVITPHPGEMARLLGTTIPEVQKDRVNTAASAAKKWDAVVLLKGSHTVIAAPDGQVFINTTGNPGLAKGGSGDVLTGLLAGLIAQFGTDDLPRIVALGAYLHGLAADLLVESTDPSGILASEVAHAIPFARRKLLQELQARD